MRKRAAIILAVWFAILLMEYLMQRYRLDIIRLTMDWPVWLRAWIWGW